MNTEITILKTIQKNREKLVHVRMIARQAGFGLDYVRYILGNLIRKELVNRKGRDLYLITRYGKKELKKKGLYKIKKEQVPRKREQKGTSSSQARAKIKNINKEEGRRIQPIKIKSIPAVSGKVKMNSNALELKEEKLTIGKKVERAILALQKMRLF